MNKLQFFPKEFTRFRDFVEFCRTLEGKWIFRGQSQDWPLKTRLERACEEFDLLDDAPKVEFQLVREFRRRYTGIDRDLVEKDTLYCLALMQHHEAPTRLLDCSYSPFVAAYFALESKPKEDRKKPSIVYCIKGEWLNKTAPAKAPKGLINKRINNDQLRRNEEFFKDLYMSENPKKFVYAENAYNLNERLIIQKGVFLCPGKVSASFQSNLEEIEGWNQEGAIIKVCLKFDLERRKEALEELHNMNVDRATLFPGLDGFSRSLQPRLPYFKKLGWKGSGK